jgi:hypothetical protein
VFSFDSHNKLVRYHDSVNLEDFTGGNRSESKENTTNLDYTSIQYSQRHSVIIKFYSHLWRGTVQSET